MYLILALSGATLIFVPKPMLLFALAVINGMVLVSKLGDQS